MAFQAHTINLTSGVRQDISEKSVGSPQMLDIAENVVITHSNSLRGRPALVSEDAVVQQLNTGGTPDVPASTLSTLAISNSLIPAGIDNSNNQLIAMYQGLAFARTVPNYNGAKTWRELGPFWSMNKSSINALDTRTPDRTVPALTNPVSVGTALVSTAVVGNTSTGLGIVSDNLAIVDTQALTNFDATSSLHACIATNGSTDIILYPKADGSLRYHLITPGVTTGTGTEVLVAGAGSVDIPVAGVGVAAAGQSCWIVKGSNIAGEFFFAYKGSVAGQIIVGRILTQTGVTATLTLTGLGIIAWGICLCHNGGVTGSTGRLCLGYYDDTATAAYKSKIITITSTTVLTDAALNVTYNTTGTAGYSPHTVGNDSFGNIVVCFTKVGPNRNLLFYTASYSSTTNTLRLTLFGGFRSWFPLTCSVSYLNRTIITLQLTVGSTAASNATSGATQWQVLDITNNLTSTVVGGPSILAAGVPNGSIVTYPLNPVTGTTNSGSLFYKFGIVEGVTFDVNGAQTYGSSVITLIPKASRAINIGNTTLFSGNIMYQFDGNQTYPLNYVEGAPIINVTSTVGGTTPASASYAAQCIWEFTTASGQIIRSAQSNVGLTGVLAAGSKVILTSTIPQTMGRYLTATNARVKFYISTNTPSAGAPLYLINTVNFPVTNGIVTAGTVSSLGIFTSSPVVDTTQEQLYTGGNIFDDQAPLGADRGICYSTNRIWAANSRQIFVSKILQPTINPAFNLSGALIINVPTNLGEVRGLGSLGDKVAVICDNGVLIIYGAGVNDLGSGPGWNTEVISSSGFTAYEFAGPRTVVSVNGLGVAYVGKDNEIYLLNYSGLSQCITRATKDTVFSISELAYCDSFSTSQIPIELGPMILGSGNSTNTKVVDLETGNTLIWKYATGANSWRTSINGVIYIISSAGFPYSYSNYSTGIDDTFGSIVQKIQTARCSVSGIEEGYNAFLAGRLRGISINGSAVFDNTHTLSVNIIDQELNTLYNNNAVSEAFYTTEYRCTTQRCSNFKITITATPAVAEWTSIDFWSWSSGDRKPNNIRA